jgi:hypothetical protein
MPVTMNDIRAWLTQDEVNYDEARKLGPDAVPLLMQLVHGGDLGLATKATYLASLIPGDASREVVMAAAARGESIVRVAAASAVRNLSATHAEQVLDALKHDRDVGVRKVLVHSLAGFKSPHLAAKVDEMAHQEKEQFLRDLAAKTAAQIR